MIPPPGFLPDRPITVPILVAAQGPKGLEVARTLADSVFSGTPMQPHGGFRWSAVIVQGTVLDEGESPASPRVLAAAGPGAALAFHFAAETGQLGGVSLDRLPGGTAWQAAIAALPERTRHLRLHEGHLVAVSERDQAVLTPDLVQQLTLTGPARAVRARLDQLEAQGVTEIAYQPAGPDIERELTAFAKAAGL